MKGFVNILKSPSYTSSDVVVIVRSIISKALNQKIKTGHLGTLDPGASGVLPIAIGSVTRLFDYMQTKRKVYRATFIFNKYSETLDSYSQIFDCTEPVKISLEDIENGLKQLQGKIKQMPPKYSSISINGKRAYDLARENKDFTLESREVEIFGYDNIKLDNDILNLDIECSSGTYIRSIAQDLAALLGTKAYMAALIRLKSGEFDINNAVTIEEFSKNPLSYVLEIDNYINLPKINLSDNDLKRVLNGVLIEYKSEDGQYLLNVNNEIIGILNLQNNILKCNVRL